MERDSSVALAATTNQLKRTRNSRDHDVADDIELASFPTDERNETPRDSITSRTGPLRTSPEGGISGRLEADPITLQDVITGSLEIGRGSAAAQGLPPELSSFAAEIVFILICSTGQLLFAATIGNTMVNQLTFVPALGISNSQIPWLVGSFSLANGLSVVVSGSLADLAGPKGMMVGAFAWMTAWNVVGFFSIQPSRKILFFIVRAMQGLSVGVLVSTSMSILGRVYKPGIRKNRVFSSMAAMAPFGFWLGSLQGGALSQHLPWIFGSSAIISAVCCIAAVLTVPALDPAADTSSSSPPSLKDFDYIGALLAVLGCGALLFGLTQGAPTSWQPYTYALIGLGLALLVAFFLFERRAPRPLIPAQLWRTPGFLPLIATYFLGFGAYVGAWQFYAVRFWLTSQHARPLTAALYLTPNALAGLLAAWIVSKTLHRVAGHWILAAGTAAYALGPVFFLPQGPGTPYWALSMLGVALVGFGPDLSFAAASVFVTSSVRRSYHGAAGSLLVTAQNLAAAVGTAVADSIWEKVTEGKVGELDLGALRAIWWFGLAVALVAIGICVAGVRMPRSEEKEHVA